MEKWYQGKSINNYVALYTEEKTMHAEIQAASNFGWTVHSAMSSGHHVNIGRTALGVATLGIGSLLFGGSRAKKQLTVVYSRAIDWAEQRAVQAKAAGEERALSVEGLIRGWTARHPGERLAVKRKLNGAGRSPEVVTFKVSKGGRLWADVLVLQGELCRLSVVNVTREEVDRLLPRISPNARKAAKVTTPGPHSGPFIEVPPSGFFTLTVDDSDLPIIFEHFHMAKQL